MREYRIQKQRRQRRKEIQRIALLALAAVLLLLILLWGGTAILKVHAVEKQMPERYKYYTEVYVHKDDTLWDIANTYMSEEYESVDDYIQEVREINSIYFSDIYYGQRLMVPYYSDEYKQ